MISALQGVPQRQHHTPTRATPLKTSLRHAQPVSATPIQRCSGGERLHLMRAHAGSDHLSQLGATPLTPSQKILNESGFLRVEIGGHDNRCWIRAPWFALLHQNTQEGTLKDFGNHIQALVNSSKCPDVVAWRNSNPQGMAQALAELSSSDGLKNHTLNAKGYFSPAVEAMIENVSKAVFHANPQDSQAQASTGPVDALQLLRQNKCGYQIFSDFLLESLGGNAPLHCDTGHFNQSSVDVEWLGSDHYHNKQADCMIFHRSTSAGHFEIMLNDPEFKPALHNTGRASQSHSTALRHTRPQHQLSSNISRIRPQYHSPFSFVRQIKQLLILMLNSKDPKHQLNAFALLLVMPLVKPSKDKSAIFDCLLSQLASDAHKNRLRGAQQSILAS